MTEQKTKLSIKIVRPPISIFRMVKGKQDIDMTYAYESAFDSADRFYFMVPDGVYLVTQADQPCVYEVCDGKVSAKPVKSAPIGNTVEDLSSKKEDKKPMKPDKGVTLAEIMHTRDKKSKV